MEEEAVGLNAKRQIIAAAIVSLLIITHGNMIGWTSPILRDITNYGRPMNLTTMEKSWMVSVLYLGNFISALPVSYLMDIVGRKIAILLLSVVALISWTLIIYARNAFQLYIARFFGGIWTATIVTIAQIYIAEIAGPKLHNVLSTFVQVNMGIGLIFEYIVGNYVSYDTLAASSFILALCFILIFWNMPESPHWLLKNDQKIAAAESLAWLKGQFVDTDKVDQVIFELNLGINEATKYPKYFPDLLTTKGRRKALKIVLVLACAQSFSGFWVILSFVYTILPNGTGIFSADDCIFVFGLLLISFMVISKYCIDFWGRKLLLLISCIGTAFGTFFIGLWYFLDRETNVDVSSHDWMPLFGLIIYCLFFSVGLGPIPFTEQSEMFMLEDQTVVFAFIIMALAITSFINSLIYLPIATNFGMYVNYWLFMTVSIMSAIFVHVHMVETKGKRLQQIYEELEGQNM